MLLFFSLLRINLSVNFNINIIVVIILRLGQNMAVIGQRLLSLSLRKMQRSWKLWKQGVVLSKSLSLKSLRHTAHVSSLASAALVGTRLRRRSSDTVPTRRARLHGGGGG